MIPKTIHYCWFGGNPLPELAVKCIESWKKYCPDYEIIEWNESNFDINCCDYVREAYDAKKWAFVSDVARLYVLVTYGGIYMDTDVEVLQPLDRLLEFEGVSGFESKDRIPTGLMACEKGHPLFQECLKEYNGIHFIKGPNDFDTTTNVVRITRLCLKYGLKLNGEEQVVEGLTFLPVEYLCPLNNLTGKIHITENTYTIHWFNGSWLNELERKSLKRSKKISRICGPKIGPLINAVIYNWQKGGFRAVISKIADKL